MLENSLLVGKRETHFHLRGFLDLSVKLQATSLLFSPRSLDTAFVRDGIGIINLLQRELDFKAMRQNNYEKSIPKI